jgi:fibronectin-binding autotransporter adhesin
MKTNIRSKFLFLGATIIGTILFVGATAPAQCILQTVNETGSPQQWNGPIWGPSEVAPTSGNCYETPSGFDVRTTNSITPAAFAGDSLQIDSGGILELKNGGETSGNAAIVNLILNGGTMNFHGGFPPNGPAVGGTLQVLNDSVITTDQTGANAADIWLESTISGSSNLTVNMLAPGTNNLVLFGTNTAYSGNWTDANGGLMIEGGTTNALGSGTVTLQVPNAFVGFNSTNNIVVSNSIFGDGSVIKWNTNTVNLSGNDTYTNSLVISNGVIQMGANYSLTNVQTITLGGGTLDASLPGGLVLNPAGQTMNCKGTVISNLTVSGSDNLFFNLYPTTNDVLNVTGSLTINGNPNLNLYLTGFKVSGTYRLINYSGTIQGGGSFTLVPPAGSAETFALNTNTPGQVNLVVTGTLLSLTWVGGVNANSWDTNSANWTGPTNVYQDGDNVTFNDSGSSVPDIDIAFQVSPSAMTVSNTINHYVFDGSSSGIGINSYGTLTKMGTNELDFTSSGNDFMGPVNIQAGILSIGVGGSFGFLGFPSSITNNGVLQVNMDANGELFSAPISGSGSINITGGGAFVTLGGTNSYSGGTTIGNGCQLLVTTSSGLGSGQATVLTGGRLGVEGVVGAMTVTNPLVINGNYEPPGGALYVNTSGANITWSGPVTIASASQLRVVNTSTLMNLSGTVLGTNVALECTAGNTPEDDTSVMTFSNTVALGGSGSLTADGLAVVVLAGKTNVWGGGTTVVSNGTLLVNGVLNGGAVTVNSATLGGSGTILGSVAVTGGVLAPGNSGIGTLTVSNSVTLDSASTNLMEINRTNAPNASLLSATSVTFNSGTLVVNNIGPTNLQAGDTFTLFAGGTISGTFAVTNLPVLPSTSLYWNTSLLSSGKIEVASTVPIITSPSISGTNFTLQVTSSQSGSNYVLQATPSLSPATWTSIYTNVGTGGTLNFTNPTPGIPKRFFRIVIP